MEVAQFPGPAAYWMHLPPPTSHTDGPSWNSCPVTDFCCPPHHLTFWSKSSCFPAKKPSCICSLFSTDCHSSYLSWTVGVCRSVFTGHVCKWTGCMEEGKQQTNQLHLGAISLGVKAGARAMIGHIPGGSTTASTPVSIADCNVVFYHTPLRKTQWQFSPREGCSPYLRSLQARPVFHSNSNMQSSWSAVGLRNTTLLKRLGVSIMVWGFQPLWGSQAHWLH